MYRGPVNLGKVSGDCRASTRGRCSVGIRASEDGSAK